MSRRQTSSVKKGQGSDNFIPEKIKITSDGNVLELISSDLKNDLHTYQYVKSKYKKGEKISFSSENLKLQLTNYFQAAKK